ncbi:MAG: hypothetical protein WA655_13980 [Candidatus Korobacteraceae bacterium]
MSPWIPIYLCLAVIAGWLGNPGQLATDQDTPAAAGSHAGLTTVQIRAASLAIPQEGVPRTAPPTANNGITISGHSQDNRFVSVPRFFKQGDIPNFAQAVVNGAPLPTQCDTKNRWPDGSLKFAIISFIVPKVTSHGPEVNFRNQPTGNNEGYLDKNAMLDGAYDFDGIIAVAGSASHSISARSILQAGHFRYWLRGPIVTAVVIEDRDERGYDVNTDGGAGNPLHPIFEAWFYPASHKVEIGFTLENSWASSTPSQSARNQDFELTLSTGHAAPEARLKQAKFTQLVFTRWRRAFWIGPDPIPIHINWNPKYLLSSGAYPNWETDALPNASAVASENAPNAKLNSARFTIPGYDDIYATKGKGLGGIGRYDQALNAGGQADWIGPATTWDIMYLLTGDPAMEQMMITNADLAGRFPNWYREADHKAGSGHYFDRANSGKIDTYGRVVSINARQQVTLNLNNWHPGCPGEERDNVNLPGTEPVGGWGASQDTSHAPDYGYIPYTLTGKYYYLEQLQMDAAWSVGTYIGCFIANPQPESYYRQGSMGVIPNVSRVEAWAIRTMAYAAFISPDGEPEGPYFADKVRNNIAMLEGEHGVRLSVQDSADRTAAYNYGKLDLYTQNTNQSPLGAWRADDCAGPTPWHQVGCYAVANNNVTAAAYGAEATFMEGFLLVTLGMVNQLGIADATPLLQFTAKRYFHVLSDPEVNHYLIEQYVYPTRTVSGWVKDWATYQKLYGHAPNGWHVHESREDTDNAYGFIAMSALGYMTRMSVDNYRGQQVWKSFESNFTHLRACSNYSPKFCINPF